MAKQPWKDMLHDSIDRSEVKRFKEQLLENFPRPTTTFLPGTKFHDRKMKRTDSVED